AHLPGADESYAHRASLALALVQRLGDRSTSPVQRIGRHRFLLQRQRTGRVGGAVADFCKFDRTYLHCTRTSRASEAVERLIVQLSDCALTSPSSGATLAAPSELLHARQIRPVSRAFAFGPRRPRGVAVLRRR